MAILDSGIIPAVVEPLRMSRRHRHRKRNQKLQHDLQENRLTGTLVPVSPEMERPGLDATIIFAVQDIDRLINDMRIGIAIPITVEDEDSAVKQYLVYVSMLIDSVLPDIIMSAIAGNDILVEIKQRLLLEYSVKGAYYAEHSHYALYRMTVGDAKMTLKKLKKARASQELVGNAERELEVVMKRFCAVADTRELTFEEMFVGAGQYGSTDDYVWLYSAPSAVLHADPEGFRALLHTQQDGTQGLTLTFPLEQVNATLVDAGRNALFFCRHFVNRYHPEDEIFEKRINDLHRRFLGLIIAHPYGRDEAALQAVNAEIAKSTAERT